MFEILVNICFRSFVIQSEDEETIPDQNKKHRSDGGNKSRKKVASVRPLIQQKHSISNAPSDVIGFEEDEDSSLQCKEKMVMFEANAKQSIKNRKPKL